MEIKLIGNPISLKEKLGNDRYEDISNFFKEELKISLEELERDIRVIEPIYWSKMEMLSYAVLGFYNSDTKELWMVDFNSGSLIHELTHVHQHKRTGLVSKIKKLFSRIACRWILQEKGTFMYQIDFWEREANEMARKFRNR